MPQSRRQILKAALAGVVAVGGGTRATVNAQSRAASASPAIAAGRMNGPLFFDVDTSSGAVRGTVNSGIRIFRGIPYGADTGGANRFMPPRKPAPWTGVRHCI